MHYPQWFAKTVKQVVPLTEKNLYLNTSIFGLVTFGALYAYTSWMKIPNVLNKSVADTATILVGLSMLLSGLCYFWNFVDTKIIYRKYLGLIGFAFAVVHVLLSFSSLKALFVVKTWQQGVMWPMLTGAIALVIFTLMALISNQYAAHQLGGVIWRAILRTGYVALVFVFTHVVLLKFSRWVTWAKAGPSAPPSTSLIVTVFVVVVIFVRLALWWSLSSKKKA